MSEQTQEQNAELTYVYRFFDESDTLLYVGIARGLEARFKQHAKDKDWFHLVARTDATPYRSRASALAAEATAILVEAPIHNRAIPTMARHDILHARAEQDPDAAMNILERIKSAERIIGQVGLLKREVEILKASNGSLKVSARNAEESAFTSRAQLVKLTQAVKSAAQINSELEAERNVFRIRIAELERENAALATAVRPSAEPTKSFWRRPARQLRGVTV